MKNPTLELRGWEESVQIEWQCVELFVPIVAFERPELDPPRHATVLRHLHIQLSRSTATINGMVGGDMNMVLKNALNCRSENDHDRELD